MPKGYRHTMDDIELAEVFEKEWEETESNQLVS